MRVRFSSKSVKPQLDESIERAKQRFQQSIDAASETFEENVIREGRADIAAAGNFGSKWTSGFTSEVSGEDGKVKTITFQHSNPLWRVFQSGATIKGKPLLWIPVEPGMPRAKDFPGRLFEVKRRRKRDTPLLMSADDRRVKYIGVKKILIRRKFHLLRIIRDEAKKMRQTIRDGMKDG